MFNDFGSVENQRLDILIFGASFRDPFGPGPVCLGPLSGPIGPAWPWPWPWPWTARPGLALALALARPGPALDFRRGQNPGNSNFSRPCKMELAPPGGSRAKIFGIRTANDASGKIFQAVWPPNPSICRDRLPAGWIWLGFWKIGRRAQNPGIPTGPKSWNFQLFRTLYDGIGLSGHAMG